VTRKAFLLRLDAKVHEALRRWARDDLRSVNAQIEFLLRRILAREGRLREPPEEPKVEPPEEPRADAPPS